MKNDTKYSELIGQYLSGNISQAERKDLFAWVDASKQNKAFFEQMVNLWTMSEHYEDDFETDTDKAWQQLNTKLTLNRTATASTTIETIASDNGTAKVVDFSPQSSPKNTKVVPFYQQLLKIAAVFLIVIGIGAIAYNNFYDKGEMMLVTTESGEREELTLPDSSQVWLNENTTFSYLETFEKREVFLEGEAFFDVEHLDGKTFEIFSGDTKVQVVGTTFNVRAYEEEPQVEVTVETGIVKVSKKEEAKTEKRIVAGQSVVSEKQNLEIKQIAQEIPNAASWKKKSLTFGENTTMKEVVESFERYYNIDIDVKNPGILKCDFTNKGTLKNPKLEEMTAILQIMLDLKFTKKGEVYELDGMPCK